MSYAQRTNLPHCADGDGDVDGEEPAVNPSTVRKEAPAAPKAPKSRSKKRPQLSSADAARVRQLAATLVDRDEGGRPVLPVKIKGDRNELTLVELGR